MIDHYFRKPVTIHGLRYLGVQFWENQTWLVDDFGRVICSISDRHGYSAVLA